MQWQFISTVELHDAEPGKRGHIYHAPLWRTQVPGGWLVMTVNGRSTDPQPSLTFLPDPEHQWHVEVHSDSHHSE